MDEHLGLDLSGKHRDTFLQRLHFFIKLALRILSVLMVVVIVWGVLDVCWLLYTKIWEEPKYLLDINDMFATFGAFLAVLIAIEIFVNIVLYLKDNVIHVKLVVATALMAVSRKIIVMDYEYIEPAYVLASAVAIFALGITYRLVTEP
jgi:uncharacterized membrane protein (DUF373 family)